MFPLQHDGVDAQEGNQQRQNGVGFHHRGHHHALALHFRTAADHQHRTGGALALRNRGEVANQRNRQRGSQQHQRFIHRHNGTAAAHDANLRHNHDSDNEAVDTQIAS